MDNSADYLPVESNLWYPAIRFNRFPITTIDDRGVLKFAKTLDFTSFHVMNAIPNDFPVTQFSAANIKTQPLFEKIYVPSGGKNADNALNPKI